MKQLVFQSFCAAALILVAAARALAASEIPDFTGVWGRNAFDLEPVSSQYRPVSNRIHEPNSTTGDYERPAGDYSNPILKPAARDIVHKRSDAAMKGDIIADPSNQCAPYQPPFVFGMQLGLEMFQKPDEITFVYNQDHQVRHVRLGSAHLAHVTPSWMGDSIAHYEGDTLVIDTIGVKPGRIDVMDRYGVPFSDSLHVVERYLLIGADEAKQAQDSYEKFSGRVGGPGGAMPIDPKYPKGLLLRLTVEDPVYLNAPLEAQVTYRRAANPMQETVCAENAYEYYHGKATEIPTALHPDF